MLGVDVSVLDFVLKFRGKLRGDVLQLGRQRLDLYDPTAAQAVLRRYDRSKDLAAIGDASGYSETLFKYLGSDRVQSMDASPYEGADIVHDLNTPVQSEWHDRFDVIFDGGTIEHVFNVPMAFDNVRRMLKVGGLFLSVNGANGFLGHGFYQFSPELMWRTFSAESGFGVELMQTVLVSNDPDPQDMEDPAVVGRRLEVGMTKGPTYLLLAARKLSASGTMLPQQSDYVSAWRSKPSEPSQPPASRPSAIKRWFGR